MSLLMSKFEFFGVGRVIFGRGEFRRVGELASALGRTALILYNGSGQIDPLLAMLSASRINATFRRQRGEPVVKDIDLATNDARRAGCDLVIGLGGGSAIDAAKAVAALLGNGGSAVDYMEVVRKGLKITRPSIPWIAIPTTAGTGAEATRNAVIGLPERQFKASIRSELMLPRIALVDPELGVNVPPDVTARSGMDALCQLIESYTSTGAGPITDALALQGITLAARSLRRAYQDGHDVDAREDMALAALLSGMTLTSAGLGAVHGFAAPLGANFPAPHGSVCAALLPIVIRANVRALRDQPNATALARYATIGRLFLPTGLQVSEDEAIDTCVKFTATLVRDLNIPPLATFGMKSSDVPALVALARKASSMRYNPVVLSDEVLAKVLGAAIAGEAL
jgi:alcohol dehydrogenase class IV